MWNTIGSDSVIVLETRGLEIKEATGYDVSPDIIDKLDNAIFVVQR